MNFPCKPPCSLAFSFFPNRCLTVCVASWVINPGFHSTKFGCSRFSSALSWDLSTRTQHRGASLSIFDSCQPQEMIWYEYDLEHGKPSPWTVSQSIIYCSETNFVLKKKCLYCYYLHTNNIFYNVSKLWFRCLLCTLVTPLHTQKAVLVLVFMM